MRDDEHALRRKDFTGGTPVRLRDGQTWFFADAEVKTTTVQGTNGPVVYPVLWLSGDTLTTSYLNNGLANLPTARKAPASLYHDIREFARESAAAMLLRNY